MTSYMLHVNIYSCQVVHLLTFSVPSRHLMKKTNEQEAKNFLVDYNQELEKLTNIAVHADWEYNTNLTEENAEKSVNVDKL